MACVTRICNGDRQKILNYGFENPIKKAEFWYHFALKKRMCPPLRSGNCRYIDNYPTYVRMCLNDLGT